MQFCYWSKQVLLLRTHLLLSKLLLLNNFSLASFARRSLSLQRRPPQPTKLWLRSGLCFFALPKNAFTNCRNSSIVRLLTSFSAKITLKESSKASKTKVRTSKSFKVNQNPEASEANQRIFFLLLFIKTVKFSGLLKWPNKNVENVSICKLWNDVWKSQEKSYSTLRAKRATFTFWVDKSSLKIRKMVQFGEFLKTYSLRSNRVTRQVSFNGSTIGGKCQNWKFQMRGWFQTFWISLSSTVVTASAVVEIKYAFQVGNVEGNT